MPVTDSPREFVDYLTDPGLSSMAGSVALSQYLCQNPNYGGNANASALIGPLRWMKEDGKGAMLDKLAGGSAIDLLLKGQGAPETFATVWDFMCRNQERLAAIRVNVASPGGNTPPKVGNIYDLYFKENRDANALKFMVADRFFGLDCIGFVANYLIYVGEWDKYYGVPIDQWDRTFKKNITASDAIQPLQILLWSGHIAIINSVRGVSADKQNITVDICQSSSGGPQCNEYVQLEATTTTTKKGYKLFKISGGTPVVPVGGYVYIMEREDFTM